MTGFFCFLGGLGLGILYIALLWGVVIRLPKIRHKGAWLMISAFVRLALVFMGLVILAQKDIGRFTWAFAGFLLVRFVAIRYEKKKIQALLKGING